MYKKIPDVFSIICDLKSSRSEIINTDILRFIKYSVLNDSYHIFINEFENPIGYIVWANVNRETIQKIYRTGAYPMFPYEWREGKIFLVIDAMMDLKINSTCYLQLKKLLKNKRALFYKNKGKNRLYVRKTKIYRQAINIA